MSFKRKLAFCFFLFIIIVLLDQIIKRVLLSDIGLNNSKQFIPGIIQFTVVKNTGGAFSIFKQYPICFQIIGIINVLVFSYLAFCPTVSLNFLTKIGCTCVLGGTVGNLIDRCLKGAVIDFLDLQLFNFAIFNVADIFINIGVGLILLGWYLDNRKPNLSS